MAGIFSAIQELSLPERGELEALPHPFADDDGDRQMKRDAQPGGKLWKLMRNVEKDIVAGKLTDFPDCTGKKRKLRKRQKPCRIPAK